MPTMRTPLSPGVVASFEARTGVFVRGLFLLVVTESLGFSGIFDYPKPGLTGLFSTFSYERIIALEEMPGISYQPSADSQQRSAISKQLSAVSQQRSGAGGAAVGLSIGREHRYLLQPGPKYGILLHQLVRAGTLIAARGEFGTLWEGNMAIYVFSALVVAGIVALVVFRIKALRKDQRPQD